MEDVASVYFDWLKTVILALTIYLFLRKLQSLSTRYTERVSSMKGIHGDPPHWIFGNVWGGHDDDTFFSRYFIMLQKYPKCQPLWIGPFIVTLFGYYPDFVKTILSTDEPKDEIVYKYLRPWIGDGLLTSHGKKWKRNRKLLSQAFHYDVLKRYLVCMNQCTAEFLSIWCSKIDPTSRSIEAEMFGDIGRLTLDNILRCLLSKQSDCQRNVNNEYHNAVQCISESVIQRIYNPIYAMDLVYFMTKSGQAYRKALKTARNFTLHIINERLASCTASDGPNSDLDFLDILLHAKDDNGNGLSHQEICDEVNTFVFEGHDTVSSGIAWALYHLAIHKRYQDRCRTEVLGTFGGRESVMWDDLSKFKFLTMCIKESLRRIPPVFSIGREATKSIRFDRGFGMDQFNCSYKIPNGNAYDFSKTFPKSTAFTMSLSLLHNHPEIWKNPFEFNPERFSPDMSSERSPFAYIPFSAGPRNCIGKHFAMIEMKVVLARILARFRIHLNEAKPKPERQARLIAHSKTGVHLRLERLEPDSP